MLVGDKFRLMFILDKRHESHKQNYSSTILAEKL